MQKPLSKPSASEARSEIIEILGQSVNHAVGLRACLEAERKALEGRDAQALNCAVEDKEKWLNHLAVLEQSRVRICEASGFEEGFDQMEQFNNWCDDDFVVANCWHHLMEIAMQCNDLNKTNGAIIRFSKQQIETRLTVLRGGSPDSHTYGRNGAESHVPGHRSLAEA